MVVLVLILTAVLWYLYHRIFTVIYVSALNGIIRELVVCFILSAVIVTTLMQILGLA